MKHKEYAAGVLTGVLVVALAAGGVKFVQQRQYNGVLSDSSHVQKIEYLEKMIDQEYLGEVDNAEMAEGIYAGLVYGLGDVYSRYYTADEYAQETASTDGAYAGIGVSIQKNKNGGVQIAECYEGGPGAEAGLQTGDVITAINDTDVTDMELSDVVSLIRENKDNTIVLTVFRENEEKSREISVDVTDVELPSVFGEMLDKKTGYIQITQFTGVTPQQYGNREEENCDGKHQLDMPLAVLVNENSASASEIFAGAVQDHEVGTIVGTTTYGKGVVQELRQLSDGSAVKLTVSNYYTPNGNSINKVGIKPDVEVKLASELLNKDEITHEEDNQLQKALNVIEN